jgi:hypothetical protein
LESGYELYAAFGQPLDLQLPTIIALQGCDGTSIPALKVLGARCSIFRSGRCPNRSPFTGGCYADAVLADVVLAAHMAGYIRTHLQDAVNAREVKFQEDLLANVDPELDVVAAFMELLTMMRDFFDTCEGRFQEEWLVNVDLDVVAGGHLKARQYAVICTECPTTPRCDRLSTKATALRMYVQEDNRRGTATVEGGTDVSAPYEDSGFIPFQSRDAGSRWN